MTRRRRHAFTLLELVLVLVIISIALATAAPALTGWGEGMRLRSAVEQTQAAAQWARDRALAAPGVYRLTVPDAAATMIVEPDPRWLRQGAAPDPHTRAFTISNVAIVRLLGSDGRELEEALFFPDGSSNAATIRIEMPSGDTADLTRQDAVAGFTRGSATGGLP